MKLPNVSLFIPLIVGLIAVSLLWKQQQEIDGLRSKGIDLERELAQRTAAATQLEKQAQAAEEKSQALETALTIAHQTSESLISAPVSKPAKAAAADGEKLSVEQVQQWLTDAADPAVMRRLNMQAQNQTLKRFGGLIQQLNLPPAQSDALLKLLADKRQNPMDTAVADLQQGIDPAQDMDAYRDLTVANRNSIDNQIHALLGDAGFSQYQDYTRNTGQSNVLNNLQTALNNTPEPLTPNQVAQVQQVLQDNNTTRITAKVITDSKDFLTPVQVQAMQDLRAIQQANSQKRNQIIQVLPTGSTPAAGKK